MTKKKSSEILADENQEIFREKVKMRKFSPESENCKKIGGKMHHGLRGDGRPCSHLTVSLTLAFVGTVEILSLLFSIAGADKNMLQVPNT